MAPTPLSYTTLHGPAMGTTWTVKLCDPGRAIALETLEAVIQATLDRITRQMSTWDPDSSISLLNRSERGWYGVPDELFHVLEHALSLARDTAGAYDPTLGKLVDLWGFGSSGPCSGLPTADDIAAALAPAGWNHAGLNRQHLAVWQPGGLSFDLSSIAKGYGVDQIAVVLDKHRIEHYLVEVGGELKARGSNEQGKPWRVSIEIPASGEDPGPESTPPVFPIVLANASVATSGDYRRYFEHDGRRYAHTLDPATGYPAVHALASVSVLHDQCMMADALATALFSMGPDHGPQYARSRRIPALFMVRHPGDMALEWTDEFTALAGNPGKP